ncbi:MAG TPA: FAD-dependent oxidoreductase, partial [Streptosporangiaceae bacterium]|nr:FAD-dependent oxidoreductase [Streptosporangiaceae bacterium]
VHLMSPGEAADCFPLLSVTGLRGATWVPSDGYADPSQLTHAFATGARCCGVTISENCPVTDIELTGTRVVAVHTPAGRLECDVLVNATGMWGARTAALARAGLAVGAVEHQYVVTEPIAGLPASLPTLRDPDGRFYVKPETGGLVVGGWEDGTRVPWPDIPMDLGPELFAPDYERFEPLGAAAAARMPAFGEAGLRAWINGPIPFSPDAEPLMGPTGEVANLFHCCGFSAGIAAAGGAGQAMAAWIIDGDPGMDLWPFDARRFGPSHTVPGYLAQRLTGAYASYYQVAYPNRELTAPRGQRRSPLHDVLAARGAVHGTKSGWERASWFAPAGDRDTAGRPAGGAAAEELTFGRDSAFGRVGDEHRAVREAAGLIDLTSFAKYEISGRGALALLQRLAGAELDVPPGRIVYTQLLNERAGIEADLTVTRLAGDRFYLVTGAGFGRHDIGFVQRHAPGDGSVTITDVTSARAVLCLTGPAARQIAQPLSHADLSSAAFPYMTARDIDLGHAPVLALRCGYTGELGWEFHVPAEYARDLYERLLAAGAAAGLRDAGYRALNSLRLEKQYLAWAADITAEDNPYAAGLGFAVRPDKPGLLAGPALRRIRDTGPAQRLCWFTAGPEVVMHGAEMLVYPGSGLRATVRSAGFGYTTGRTIFSACLPAAAAGPVPDGGETGFEVEVAGERFPAVRHGAPLYDPAGARVRG